VTPLPPFHINGSKVLVLSNAVPLPYGLKGSFMDRYLLFFGWESCLVHSSSLLPFLAPSLPNLFSHEVFSDIRRSHGSSLRSWCGRMIRVPPPRIKLFSRVPSSFLSLLHAREVRVYFLPPTGFIPSSGEISRCQTLMSTHDIPLALWDLRKTTSRLLSPSFM